MAHAGIASRRKSEEIIAQGRVRVNGTIVTEMGCQVSDQDTISVDDIPIEREEKVYILLNKDARVVSTVDDPKDRETVLDSLEGVSQRVYPVGRLDYDTTGALLLTNDGTLANMLMHPKYEFNKTYVAKVSGQVTKSELGQLEIGVVIDGEKTAPAQAMLLSYDASSDNSIVELIIHEGRNHQVKHMMKAIGHPVKKLTRKKYGFLDTKGLRPGEWRYLKKNEVNRLYNSVT